MKAVRSLEIGKSGLEPEPWTDEELAQELEHPTDERLFGVAEALRRDWSEARVAELTRWDPWFIRKMRNLVNMEAEVRANPTADVVRRAKVGGFGGGDRSRSSIRAGANSSPPRRITTPPTRRKVSSGRSPGRRS